MTLYFWIINNTVFGKGTQKMDVIDKIANVPTNELDQPINTDLARIIKIIIE
ncbi:MAG: hypothetical protein ACTHLL_03970 [Candidatus Nitrosocosmicus sp.]